MESHHNHPKDVSSDLTGKPLFPEKSSQPVPVKRWRKELTLALGALGVVYGDIGTSPLYAVKECFTLPHGVDPTEENVFGVLSLIFWSLTLVVVVKYLTFVMRADNRGEGGCMALLTLLLSATTISKKYQPFIIMAGLFGTSLLWADGMITPSITVLSAIEGLELATPVLQPFVVPLTIIILISLFMMQRRGTAGIGAIFGPAMLFWFLCIGGLGLPWIIREPHVLLAINPYHALLFFIDHKLHGILLLGFVVLCITGCEALYADMGHFGRFPIRLAWYIVVFPALLLNYFGQGAILIVKGADAISNPFYMLATGWFLYPMVLIAAMASIIASQSMITGAFSLAQQAMQLGFSPRWTVKHTSEDMHGQIYIPEVNTILMIACVILVATFKKSSSLAAAYGFAASGTMTITSFLLFFIMLKHWQWHKWQAVLLTTLFLSIDLLFLGANSTKIGSGGWFPLMAGVIIYTVMSTWKMGSSIIGDHIRSGSIPLDVFMADVEKIKPIRVSGTAVFLTSNANIAPPVLLHHYKHNKTLHEKSCLSLNSHRRSTQGGLWKIIFRLQI